eukprot:4781147-Pyramimonas_sp.AAC.1
MGWGDTPNVKNSRHPPLPPKPPRLSGICPSFDNFPLLRNLGLARTGRKCPSPRNILARPRRSQFASARLSSWFPGLVGSWLPKFLRSRSSVPALLGS